MNKASIRRNKLLFQATINSFILGLILLSFFIWVLFDRSDMVGPVAVAFYILFCIATVGLVLFTSFAYQQGKKQKEPETIKYSLLAFFTSFLLIGQWIYWYTYKESGVEKRKISDTLYLYYSSKIESLIDSGKYIKKLNERDRDQVEILLDFKKTGVIKKYEANFYISRIMTKAGVLKDVPLVREELQIIASNLI